MSLQIVEFLTIFFGMSQKASSFFVNVEKEPDLPKLILLQKSFSVQLVVHYSSEEECSGVRSASDPFITKTVPPASGEIVLTQSDST